MFQLLRDIPRSTLRTDKAKGISILASTALHGLRYSTEVCETTFQVGDPSRFILPADIEVVLRRPLFARPCPQHARHGFVPSRTVRSMQDLYTLYDEVRREDPLGEVLLQRPIPGDWSAIITEAGVVFGPAHDGATAGCDSVTLPVKSAFDTLYKIMLRNQQYRGFTREEIDAIIPNELFIEVVGRRDSKTREIVQLRDGPRINLSAGLSHIPRDMKVERVIDARTFRNNLPKFERLVAYYTGERGCVLYHPGGNLSSHFAIHAIQAGWAVLCDDAPPPAIGTRLSETRAPGAVDMTRGELQYLADCLHHRLHRTEYQPYNSFDPQIALAALHGSMEWSGADQYSRLRAYALGALIKLSTAICAGEMRHIGKRPARCQTTRRGLVFVVIKPNLQINKTEIRRLRRKQPNVWMDSRERIYVAAAKKAPNKLAEILMEAIDGFGQPDAWAPDFGGPAWELAATATKESLSACNDFIADPSNTRWQDILARWNILTNIMHNNGLLFSKLLGPTELDAVAEIPGMLLCNRTVYKVMKGEM